jgi:endothelin-converting enzyme/putative endopeptidase
MNVAVPDFFKALNSAIEMTSLDDLKSYLVWHYVSNYAPLLSKQFVDLNFDFYGRYLTGAKELLPRWKRCVQLTDRSLGEALGQKYVEKAFGGQSKEKTQQLVNVIEQNMETDIKSLTWMSDATKQQALAKLHGVTNKIGYPEKWRDYSSVKVADDDLVGDAARAREFEVHRNLNKIGKPVDRAEFGMTPPTVNAYYSPWENNINFPAGILQTPFYTSTADMAVNFGGIGAVIGHELTHGFDDQGRQYDADGNLRDWWTAEDAAEFKKRADCIANEYSGFSPVEGEHINGRLTLGENGADNAGIRLAYMALLGGLENGTVDKNSLDGFTPQQRFFLGYAQIWCQNQRPESLRTSLRTNPHSPGEFRVIGVVRNMPEFAKAFGCSESQPMVAANGCRVW